MPSSYFTVNLTMAAAAIRKRQFDRLRTRLLAGRGGALRSRLEAACCCDDTWKSRMLWLPRGRRLRRVRWSDNRRLATRSGVLGVHRQGLDGASGVSGEPRDGFGEEWLDLARSLIAVGRLKRSTGESGLRGARASGEEARSLAKEVATTVTAAEKVPDVLAAAIRPIALVLDPKRAIPPSAGSIPGRIGNSARKWPTPTRRLSGVRPDGGWR